MGAACNCSHYIDSETFIKEMFSTTFLINITASDIDNILFNRIKGGNDFVGKTNLEITEEAYTQIASDIYESRYLQAKRGNETIKGNDTYKEFTKNFFRSFFPFINMNNNVNCLIFRLLMCPFIIKKEAPFEQNALYLFNAIRCVSFTGKDWDFTEKSMKYVDFCDTFATYLAMILSGYSKLISSLLNENNCDELMMNELNVNLTKYFDPDILKEYYTVITKKLRKKIEDANNNNIENYSVNGDDFLYFCKEEPYVLNYFELRANFIKFAKDKVNNTMRKEKI